MEIIQKPQKPKPWTERLVEMSPTDKFYVEASVAQTISSAASRMKMKYPERNWTVVTSRDTKSGELTHATVTCIA